MSSVESVESVEKPTAVMRGGEVVSSCCGAEVTVSREVRDTVVYWPVRIDDPELPDFPAPVLRVTYGKVYAGEADAYVVTCSKCSAELAIEISEE